MPADTYNSRVAREEAGDAVVRDVQKCNVYRLYAPDAYSFMP